MKPITKIAVFLLTCWCLYLAYELAVLDGRSSHEYFGRGLLDAQEWAESEARTD
jgi:hypothetical protein